MSKKVYEFYEETWFCFIVYLIFFPLGLFLAFRSRKVSNDTKNLMKFGVVILLLLYAYFIASFFRFENNNAAKTVLSDNTENLDIVNKEEFMKQGNSTVKDIEKLLSKYKAKTSYNETEEVKSEEQESEKNNGNNKDKGVSSAGNMVKVKGDPYEYNVSYSTSTEGNIGEIDVLVTVKYPEECVLDFGKSQFVKDILSVMEGDNYDIDSFKSWTEKSQENYSGKNVINSSVYSRNVSNVEETLNFNAGKEGIMQINFKKKVEVQ